MGRPPGRKPRPTAIKVLEETRRDRVNQAEPAPIEGDPEPPEYLDATGLDEWNRIVPMLRKMGVLSLVDGAAIGLYCASYGRYVKADGLLKKHGMLVPTGSGGLRPSPYLQIARAEMTSMTKALAEFGGTPSSRSRLKVESPGVVVDPLELFLKEA